jgi:hypothetical protein
MHFQMMTHGQQKHSQALANTHQKHSRKMVFRHVNLAHLTSRKAGLSLIAHATGHKSANQTVAITGHAILSPAVVHNPHVAPYQAANTAIKKAATSTALGQPKPPMGQNVKQSHDKNFGHTQLSMVQNQGSDRRGQKRPAIAADGSSLFQSINGPGTTPLNPHQDHERKRFRPMENAFGEGSLLEKAIHIGAMVAAPALYWKFGVGADSTTSMWEGVRGAVAAMGSRMLIQPMADAILPVAHPVGRLARNMALTAGTAGGIAKVQYGMSGWPQQTMIAGAAAEIGAEAVNGIMSTV